MDDIKAEKVEKEMRSVAKATADEVVEDDLILRTLYNQSVALVENTTILRHFILQREQRDVKRIEIAINGAEWANFEKEIKKNTPEKPEEPKQP